jgi:hypothetical protein
MEVGTDPVAQAFRLADINHFALGVFVQVHAGQGGNRADFLLKVHGECASILEEPEHAGSISGRMFGRLDYLLGAIPCAQ